MDKKRITAVVIVVLLVIAAIGVNVWDGTAYSGGPDMNWEEEIVRGNGEYQIVQLFVQGVITDSPDWSDTFDYYSFISQLEQVKNNDRVKGIVIRVDSPGGSVVASDEIYQKLVDIKKAGKKVVVSMGNMAASGGYYISAPADLIFAHPATITGSLGVIFSFYNYQEAADRFGIKEYVIKSGPFKDIGNPMRAVTQQEMNIFESLVDESYERFVDIIAEWRNMPRDKVVKLADGRIFSGKQAKQLGLIDELGDLEKATDAAIKLAGLGDATVIRYIEPFTIEGFFKNLGVELKKSLNPLDMKNLDFMQQPQLMYLFKP